MSATGWVFLIIGIFAAVVFLLWLVLGKFYKRSTKETAFVRTGFGGQKVVMNGGALVFPVIHEIIPVNMTSVRLGVTRSNEQALITRDFMRVNVQAEFYVRVRPTSEDIASAAQTLGHKTMNPESLKSLVEGKFVDMLRAVSASMTMEEIHQQRMEFGRKVQAGVAEDLVKNGLELESVSMTELDQAEQKYFDPHNAFDARGLTALTEEIQTRRRQRNIVERDTEVAIQKKNLEAERQKLNLSKEEEFARLEQQFEVQVRRAEQQAMIVREQAEKEQQAKEAQITVKQRLEQLQIQAEQAVEEERIARERLLKEKETEKERVIQDAQIKAKQFLDQVQLEARQKVDQAQIASERIVEEERIARDLLLREREIGRAEALEAAEVQKNRIVREAQIAAHRILEQAQVEAEKEVEAARIAREGFLKEKEIARERLSELAEVERRKAVALAEEDRNISLLEKSREHAAAQSETEKVRLTATQAEERVTTARQVEIAERQKTIELIEARKRAERDATALIVSAEARKKAAQEQATADKVLSDREAEKLRIAAEAEAQAEMTRTEAAKRRYTVDAAGARALHEAENTLSPEVISMKVRMQIIEHLAEIIRESVKPMESIEGIKIFHVEGLNTGMAALPSGRTTEPGAGGQSLADQLVNSALRYRGQAPLVDAILKEIGLRGGELDGLTGPLTSESARKEPDGNEGKTK